MKKSLLLLLPAILIFTACNSGKKEDPGKFKPEEHANAPAENVQVLKAYLNLKDALVSSSPEEASTASSNLVSMIGGFGSNEEFMAIQTSAQAIAEKEDLEEQRQAFEELSEEVYELCKKEPCGQKIYKQYCPMAFDFKGAAWIAAEKEIRNPYFGDKMMKCGEVKETL